MTAIDVLHPETQEVVLGATRCSTKTCSTALEAVGVDEVKVRTPLTCATRYGICAKCYGRDLGRGGLINVGEAIGVIAAQSIGEPGTQLTMRTFHIGGAASRAAVASSVDAKSDGVIGFNPTMRYVTNGKGELVVISRSGEIIILDPHGRERERHKVPYGALLNVKADQQVKAGHVLANWDPLTRPIITEFAGRANFENVEEGVTVAKQVDEVTGLSTLVVIDPKRRGAAKIVRPQVKLLDAQGHEVKIPGTDHSVTIGFPVGSLIQIRDGQDLAPGEVLARIPVEGQKTRDITGGLPRVAELFEARTPKDKGTLAEKTGTVSFGKETKGKVRLQITDPEGNVYEELVPKEKNILVHEGQVVNKGESVVDGPADPQDILRLLGVEELARYIVDEVQDVYRLQGVKINDKHIEVIVRQMLRRVQITNPGDTHYILGEQVERSELFGTNDKMRADDKLPATYSDVLLGITKASLSTDSLHLGRVLPGNDARAHRGCHHGQARRAAWPEGKRHRRPPDPGRHRHGLPPGSQGQGRDGRDRAPRDRVAGGRGTGRRATGAAGRGPRGRRAAGRVSAVARAPSRRPATTKGDPRVALFFGVDARCAWAVPSGHDAARRLAWGPSADRAKSRVHMSRRRRIAGPRGVPSGRRRPQTSTPSTCSKLSPIKSREPMKHFTKILAAGRSGTGAVRRSPVPAPMN